MKRRDVLKTALAGATTLAAPRIVQAEGAKTITFTPHADLASLDPVWTTADITRNFSLAVYDTLYGYDADFNVQPQMVEGHGDRANHAGLGGLHRVVLVVHRRGRARHVVDLVHLQVNGRGDVVLDDLEERIVEEVQHVVPLAGLEVVEAQHLVTLPEQPLAQMRAQESCSARYQDALRNGHRCPLESWCC